MYSFSRGLPRIPGWKTSVRVITSVLVIMRLNRFPVPFRKGRSYVFQETLRNGNCTSRREIVP